MPSKGKLSAATLCALALVCILAAPAGASGTYDFSKLTPVKLPSPSEFKNAVPEGVAANSDGTFSVIAALDNDAIPEHMPNASGSTRYALGVLGPDGRPRTMSGGGAWKTLRGPAHFKYLKTFAFIPDGGMYAVFSGSTKRTRYKVAILRFRPDGSRDWAFGDGGSVKRTSVRDSFEDQLALYSRADGTAVLAESIATAVTLTSFRSNGKPEGSFGKHGVVSIPHFTLDCVDPGGSRLLVSGLLLKSSGDPRAGEVRAFTRHGRQLKSFGNQGIVTLPRSPEGDRDSVALGTHGYADGSFSLYTVWAGEADSSEFSVQRFASDQASPAWSAATLFEEPPSGDTGDPDVYEQQLFATPAATYASYLSAFYPGSKDDYFAFAKIDPLTSAASTTELKLAAGSVVETIVPATDGSRVLALTSSKNGKTRGNMRAYLVAPL